MKEALLKAQIPENRILYFDSIDSTNSRAKLLAAQGAEHGTILLANHQTDGRGRIGRSFHSPAGLGVYLTMILRPQCQASQLMHLTCAAAVAACDAVEAVTSLRPGIKWTNDLVSGKQKLGGILTELSLDAQGNVSYALIGIGLNCNHQPSDFPEEIRPIATSLAAISGKPVDRGCIAVAIVSALDNMAGRLLTDKPLLLERYRADCVTIGKEVSVHSADSMRHGTAVGVDENGGLEVFFPDGHIETVNSGEVSIRGMYGYL